MMLLAPGLRAAMIPPIFPTKQLVFRTDEVIVTRNRRPGDGVRRRLKPGWKALSAERSTFVDDEVPAIRRQRSLDFLYYPVRSSRVLRMNNQSEFCAWALEQRILEVEFLDLGLVAGKDDCGRDADYYYRTQHPENDETLYVDGGPGVGLVNPFAGRPTDAMYGDYFQLAVRMEQRVARADGSDTYWKPLGSGDTAEGQGKVRFYLDLTSEDILPVKVLDVLAAVDMEEQGGTGKPERVEILYPMDEVYYPDVLSAGESKTWAFEETWKMRDLDEKIMRVHFLVDFEDPWGRRVRKVERVYYWKSGW